MSRETELLYVKKISEFGTITAGQSRLRRFHIGLGRNESISIHRMYIYLQHMNVLTTMNWALLQKDERSNLTQTNPLFRNDDNDILARGIFTTTTTTTTAEPQRQIVMRQEVVFDPPIIIPRSPSLEVHSSASVAVSIGADLQYIKRKETDKFISVLLMRYLGRKQDVVSNVPRVTDEFITTPPGTADAIGNIPPQQD